MGRFMWIVALLLWFLTLVGYWFYGNKLDAIYGMCISIGLMLISSRMIDEQDT